MGIVAPEKSGCSSDQTDEPPHHGRARDAGNQNDCRTRGALAGRSFIEKPVLADAVGVDVRALQEKSNPLQSPCLHRASRGATFRTFSNDINAEKNSSVHTQYKQAGVDIIAGA
jgi:hypothetical protein